MTSFESLLFSQFIRMKVHASGWPENIQSEAQRTEFVREYRRRGIHINPAKMKFNAGSRYIAKIANNRYVNYNNWLTSLSYKE
jgi:hypothetical protein